MLLQQIVEESLGKDITPSDIVPDSVACADTLTKILNKADYTFPHVSGTYSLYDILENRLDWKQIAIPTALTVIVSPTGMGKKGTIGHCGIFLDSENIASNDSSTGKFTKNYTLDTWRKRYAETQSMPVLLYKKIT